MFTASTMLRRGWSLLVTISVTSFWTMTLVSAKNELLKEALRGNLLRIEPERRPNLIPPPLLNILSLKKKFRALEGLNAYVTR
jgi:hypothetical protein